MNLEKKREKFKLKKKIYFSILLHSVGDTIGFKNGDWEFFGRKNYKNLNKSNAFEHTLELVYEYISLGGYSGLDINGWLCSDDTLSHMALIKSLSNNFKSKEELCKNFSDELCNVYFNDTIKKEFRFWGSTTKEAINDLHKKRIKWNNSPYDNYKGGSGAAMRSLCLGLVFNNQNKKLKLKQNEMYKTLVEYSIDLSRITHNSVFGYLGGVVCALFSSFAFDNFPIHSWYELMRDTLDLCLDSIMKKLGRDYDKFLKNKNEFFNKWTKYDNYRFNTEYYTDKSSKFIERKSDKNLYQRIKKLYELFSVPEGLNIEQYNEENKDNNFISYFPGSNGCDSMIFAYDALLFCDGSYEKLIYYSILHCGDSDTVGCISSGLFASFYTENLLENNNFNKKINSAKIKNLIDSLELKNKLEDLANKLYEKYYS